MGLQGHYGVEILPLAGCNHKVNQNSGLLYDAFSNHVHLALVYFMMQSYTLGKVPLSLLCLHKWVDSLDSLQWYLDDIRILPADKCCATVVMKKEDYLYIP